MLSVPRRTCFYLFLLLTLLPGCRSQGTPGISGHINITPDLKPQIYLVMPRSYREITADYQGQVLDSALIADDGTFRFDNSKLPATRTILQLVVQSSTSRFANHLADEIPAEANYMPFIYTPGEPIVIEADGNAFHATCSFTNSSVANQQITNLRDLRIKASENYAFIIRDIHDDSQIIEKEKAHLAYLAPLMHFADTTPVAEVALIAIRWISPTNDFERIPEFITGMCTRLTSDDNRNSFTNEACAMADPQHLAVMVGDTIPDSLLPMASGDTVGLHSLLGSKLTILDIWASWCAPCRIENRNVLFPLWKRYREAGLQIIGYALESEADAWKTAIQKDNAVWSHASHLTGDSGPFLDALRITTIPANYILDSNGIVLARNVHGAELEKFILASFNN